MFCLACASRSRRACEAEPAAAGYLEALSMADIAASSNPLMLQFRGVCRELEFSLT